MKIKTADNMDIDMISLNDPHISKAELEYAIGRERVYTAYENGIFIGWLRYNLFWDNTPFMNMLYVLEKYRGKGIGKALVEYWERQMKTAGFSAVMTSTSSEESAQHFYNKIGYCAVGGFVPVNDAYELIFLKRI